MYTDLFFVPDSLGDQKRKERIDSSCRAHNMRIVHQKRRATRDLKNSSTRRRTKHEFNPAILQYPFKSLHSSSATHSPESVLPAVELPEVSSPEFHRQSAYSPNAMKAVDFVRFHLVKSWSPTFMQRIHDANNLGTEFGDDLALAATRWMWSMWQSDSNLFWSVVASILPVMVRYVSHDQKADIQKLALELRASSFQGLMTTLEDCNEIPEHKLVTTIYHVKSLFREACANGDQEAARHHSHALAGLATRLHEYDDSIEHRRIVLWGDALPALLQLRRPVVDFSITMAQITDEIWSDADSNFQVESTPVLPSIDYTATETLRKAFEFYQKALHMINDPRTIRKECLNFSTESLFQWMTSKAEHHICELLHLYHDLINDDITRLRCSIRSEGEQYMEACICLTLLYLYQKTFFDIYQDDGTDVNESALLIRPALMKTLQSAEMLCSRSEWMFYRRLVFWVIFVGAWAEQNLNRTLRYSDYITARDYWFTAQLPKHAQHVGLDSWFDAKRALNEFGWANFLCEEAERWYGEILSRSRQASNS